VSRVTRIEPASGADLAEAANLAVLHSGRDQAYWLTRLAGGARKPGCCLLIAHHDSRVAGYGRVTRFDPPPDSPANVVPAGYYLGGVVVHPAFRRMGIGDRLTKARMDWTAGRADEIWYLTNAANEASLRLHERHGFHEMTRDFAYPGVTFAGGAGVLCRAALVSR
jgi:ribosomal protein S18 acetylase RimI-like enzyme